MRTSALVVSRSGLRVLIDCGPDFRQQAIRVGLDHIDAIVLTHEHYDHVYGLDDLRTISWRSEIPIYGQTHVLDAIRRRMHYVFSEHPYPGTPHLALYPLEPGDVLRVGELEISPIVVMHGDLPIYGYRFHEEGMPKHTDICYITDMKEATSDEWHKVDETGVLVVNALRYLKEHPSHQNVLDVEQRIQSLTHPPRLTLLTHLSHHAPNHGELEQLLPEHIRPGYDLMCVEVDASGITTECFRPAPSPFTPESYLLPSLECVPDRVQQTLERLERAVARGKKFSNLVELYADRDGTQLIGHLYLDTKSFALGELDPQQMLEELFRHHLHTPWLYPGMPVGSYPFLRLTAKEYSGFWHLSFALDVNTHIGATTSSIASTISNPQPIDATVVKHMITREIYRSLQSRLRVLHSDRLKA